MATTLNNVRLKRGFCLHVTHDTCDCARAKTLLFQVVPNMSAFTLTPFTLATISNFWTTSIHILIESLDNRILRESSLSTSQDTLLAFTILLFLFKNFSNLLALSTKYSDRVILIWSIILSDLFWWNSLNIFHSSLIIDDFVDVIWFLAIISLLRCQSISISSNRSKNIIIVLTTTETPLTFASTDRESIGQSRSRIGQVTKDTAKL